MNQLVDTYVGLLGLALVLYFLFSQPAKTEDILRGSAAVGSQFVSTLEAR